MSQKQKIPRRTTRADSRPKTTVGQAPYAGITRIRLRVRPRNRERLSHQHPCVCSKNIIPQDGGNVKGENKNCREAANFTCLPLPIPLTRGTDLPSGAESFNPSCALTLADDGSCRSDVFLSFRTGPKRTLGPGPLRNLQAPKEREERLPLLWKPPPPPRVQPHG